jgi:hypothetical protein
MGKPTGSTKVQQVETMTGSQKEFWNNLIEQLGPDAIQQLGGLISPGDTQEMFQQAFVDPAMMAFEKDVMPAIQERFGGDTGSSSALNQTLAQSAESLGTLLGSQMGQFAQNQQQLQLSALGQVLSGGQVQTQQPVMTQQQGWLDPTLQAAMTLGAAFI